MNATSFSGRSRAGLCVVVAIALVGNPTRAQRPSPEAMREADPEQRREWFVGMRAGPDGRIPLDRLAAMKDIRVAAGRGAFAATAGPSWEPLGPMGFISMNTPYSSTPMTDEGRFTSVAFHPRDPRIILAGAGGAGVWRTMNGGASWQALGDAQCSMSIGAIAIDPVDPTIVYAGTGEIFDASGYTDGCGILKSTNMGDSWTRTAASQLSNAGSLGGLVYDLAIDRATAGSATSTTLFAATSVGLLRSTNSGASWVTVRQGFATNVKQHPTRPEVWYAGIGNPNGAAGNGIVMSTDGGNTWTVITGIIGSPTTIGRISLAVTPARSGSLWVLIGNPANRKFRTLARWDEETAQWTLLAANGIIFSSNLLDFGEQSEYNLTIGVDPVDENRVIIGGVRLFRSRDGGQNFTQIAANVHSDWHGLAFNPQDSRRMIAACDGGLFMSTDAGGSWRSVNNGITATQFYPGIAVHPTNPAVVVGGTQDNGSMMSGGALFWAGISFGDGGAAMIDYTNPNIVMTSSQFGNLQRHDLAARSFTPLQNHLNFQPPFITPFVMDPIVPRTIYAGTRALERSEDFGSTWQVLSPTVSSDITAVAIGRGTPRVYFFGTRSGLIAWSSNGGASWVAGTAVSRAVSDVAADPSDPQRFAITHSGFGNLKVLVTPDAGTNFANVSGDLPDVPINSFAFTPARNRFYVGTDIGVFETTDGGGTWVLTPGLPLVPVTDLVYHAASNRLIAGTYGRGIWTLPLTIEPPVLRGDVDRNGVVNAADALLIQQGLSGIQLPSPLTIMPQGDANCNGVLDAADALVVLRFAVGLGSQGTCVNTLR